MILMLFRLHLLRIYFSFSFRPLSLTYIQIYKEYPSICQYKHIAAVVGLTDRYLRPIPC